MDHYRRTVPAMEQRVPRWVRLGMVVALAAPQLVVGLWAVLAPRSWFDSFPGLDPRLVAAEPPFNAHLATDAGAGFLATGIALLVAALIARRGAVYVSLATYAAFAVPHALYHAINPAPGLTGGEDLLNVLVLASGIVMAAVLAWGAWAPSPAREPRSRVTRPDHGVRLPG